MSNDHTTLRDAILALCEVLDPHHQGEQWPDPIAWDGRDLVSQARDMLALGEDHDEPRVRALAVDVAQSVAKATGATP